MQSGHAQKRRRCSVRARGRARRGRLPDGERTTKIAAFEDSAHVSSRRTGRGRAGARDCVHLCRELSGARRHGLRRWSLRPEFGLLGAFFSSGLTAIAPVSLAEGWEILPARVTYARYVAQWNETGPFRTWLEHVPAGVTVDLALTNYHCARKLCGRLAELPLNAAILLPGDSNVAQPRVKFCIIRSPSSSPGISQTIRAAIGKLDKVLYTPPSSRMRRSGLCSTHERLRSSQATSKMYTARRANTCAPINRKICDSPLALRGVHPYRAVDNYGVAPSGMSEFEEQCGDCHPWFTRDRRVPLRGGRGTWRLRGSRIGNGNTPKTSLLT